MLPCAAGPDPWCTEQFWDSGFHCSAMSWQTRETSHFRGLSPTRRLRWAVFHQHGVSGEQTFTNTASQVSRLSPTQLLG